MEPDLIDAGIYRAVPQGRDEGSWGFGVVIRNEWGDAWDIVWPPATAANKQAEDRRQKGEA